MEVVNINFKNKTFTTEDGTEYPLMFDVDSSITIEEFQLIIDKSEMLIKELLHG